MGNYLAIDVGTTTIAAVVLDTDSAQVIARHSTPNDSRLSGDGKPPGRSEWDIDRMVELSLAVIRTVAAQISRILGISKNTLHVRLNRARGRLKNNLVRNGRGNPSRFGLRIFGTKGVLELHDTGYLPDVRFLSDSSWSPGRTGKKWIPISSAGLDKPEPIKDGGLHAGNVAAVKDLIAAIEEDRRPVSNIYEARIATEMIVAVFESHRVGGPVTFPLTNRKNPLTML